MNEALTLISWEPPSQQANSSPIDEYSAYLSVKVNQKMLNLDDLQRKQSYTFLNIYTGQNPFCEINSDSLIRASIDNSNKPAVLLRIAAKNDKGYGPATQVRWLQGINLT